MHVVILGAGVTGVAAAWYLNQSGHEVTVLERQAAAGMETSFANGGQISVSHAEPWANPHAPLQILKWLAREDAPLLFRLRADWQQWKWGLAFLRECTPARTRHNIAQLVNLGLYSRAALQALRAQTALQYDQVTRGILHFYTSAVEWEHAQKAAETMRAYGCDLRNVDAAGCVAIEPALAPVRHLVAGATMTASDESGDAHKFTQGLAALCARAGVRLRHGVTIEALTTAGAGAARRLDGVRICNKTGAGEIVKADAYLLCLGSYSPLLVRPLGINLNIYPAKGYSVTMPVADAAMAPTVSLTDDEYKLVFSRLGDRLRIAGTAELNGYNTELNAVRCNAILQRAQTLFPGAGDTSQAQFWAGLRPATPSNVPYIGASRIANLYLNTGHGTLGWTHACGSGQAIADLLSGRQPEVDFSFCAAA